MFLKKSVIRWFMIWFVASLLWQPAFAWMTDTQNNTLESIPLTINNVPPCHSKADTHQTETTTNSEQAPTFCCDEISCDCQHMTSVILPESPKPSLNIPASHTAIPVVNTALQSSIDNLYRPPIV